MRFSVTALPYAAVPSLGPDHLLSRLAAGELPDFPLLTAEAAPETGGETPVVVAGQQPGLLTGPLYTALKAASVIGLARALTTAWKRPVRPLFWVAAEDHDILEVNRTILSGRRLICPYEKALRRGAVPQVGDISLEPHRAEIAAFVREALPDTEFKPAVVERIETCRYDSYATQFTDLVGGVFEAWNLSFVDPRSLRPATSPVLARIVERWPEALAAFKEGAARLERNGFLPPLASLGFFEIVEGRRVPVEVADGRVSLSTGSCSVEEAAARIRSEPSRFSPGAALRPILQDAVLPVAATVAGPTELVYLWQVRELYDVAGVRPSPLVPRLSATFIEPGIERKAIGASIAPAKILDVIGRLEVLAAAAEGPGASSAADTVEAAGRALLEALSAVQTPSNERWVGRTGRTLEGVISKAVGRIRKEANEAGDLRLSRLRAVADAVLPQGKPQERVVNVFDFLVRYGPAWTRALCEDLDPWALHHQLVTFVLNPR